MQAAHEFKGGLKGKDQTHRQQGVTERSGLEDVVTICTGFEGSQATLNALVTSIYRRTAQITEKDVVEILAMADFLQVCPEFWILGIPGSHGI